MKPTHVLCLLTALASLSWSQTDHLTFVDLLQDGQGSQVYGLRDVDGMAVSVDGGTLYALSRDTRTVSWFALDPDGADDVAYGGVLRTAEGTQEEGGRCLAVSPDGRHLYIGHRNLVQWCDIDEATGALGALDTVEHRSAIINGIAVSPEGRHVYTADGNGRRVGCFDRDSATGALTLNNHFSDSARTIRPAAIALSADGLNVYGIAGVGSGGHSLWWFNRDTATGELTHRGLLESDEDSVSGLSSPISLCVSGDGANVYVAAADTIMTYGRDSLTGDLTVVDDMNVFVGTGGTQFSASQIVIGPGDDIVYVCGGDDVSWFSRDTAAAGVLTHVATATNGADGVAGMANASIPVLSPDGTRLYVYSEADMGLTWFDCDTTTGELTFDTDAPLAEDTAAVSGVLSPRSMALTTDETMLYVCGYMSGTLAWFSRDTADGSLACLGELRQGVDSIDGLYRPSWVTLSPDERHVYVAAEQSRSVAWFALDPADGTPTFAGVVKDGDGDAQNLHGSAGVTVSPDGRHVYVASRYEDAVTWFSRDTATGDLTFLGVAQDTVDGVQVLDYARCIVFADQGTRAYIASEYNGAVAWYSRDTTTGDLAFDGAVLDRDTVVGRLQGAAMLAISPDGKHVYVPVRNYDAIKWFAREPNGDLTFAGALTDGVEGVDGLAGAASVAFAQEGTVVLVTGVYDDALTWFSRDTVTGELTMGETIARGTQVPVGLDGAMSLMVTRSGSPMVYVGASRDDAISWFDWSAVGIRHAGTLSNASAPTRVVSTSVRPDGAWALTVRTPRGTPAVLDVFNARGQVLLSVPLAKKAAGNRVVLIPSGSLSPGRYVARVSAGEAVWSGALTLVR